MGARTSTAAGNPATTEVLRWARALTAASLLLVSGVAAHTAAGGALPGTPFLLGVLGVTTVVLTPLLGAPPSMVRAALLVVSAQGLLHVVLSLASATANSVSAAGAMPAAHAHAPAPDLLATLTAGGHLRMLLLHVLATLFLGLWLAAGERATWALVDLASTPLADALVCRPAAAFARAATVIAAGPADVRPAWIGILPPPPHPVIGCDASRRGPPA